MVSLGMGINDNGFIRGLVGPLVNRKVGNKTTCKAGHTGSNRPMIPKEQVKILEM